MNRKPEGISHVIVNGEVVVDNKKLTGATPGRLIRRTWRVPGNTAGLLAVYESRLASASRNHWPQQEAIPRAP